MVRVRKPEEHTAKRNEILDAALQLVYSKGYGSMTIQDILDRLQISKGAFYHYFDSKASVLQALVERMAAEQVEPLILAAVHNPRLSAIEKLQAYFDTSARWKTAEKAFMMELIRVWYSDENALARQKMYDMLVEHVRSLLIEIIEQGVREGTFTTTHPEHTAQICIQLIQSIGDTFARMLLSPDKQRDHPAERAAAMLEAYGDAIERILGAPRGSIHLMKEDTIAAWFAPGQLVG